MANEPDFLREFDAWSDAFIKHVDTKGKVNPNEYRAFGYRPPSHFWADAKTKWRGLRMALGRPIEGTSPAIQQERGLNRDATVFYKRGEGARRRDDGAR